MGRALKLLGVALLGLGLILASRLALTYTPRVFEFAGLRIPFIQSTASDIGQYASALLWTYRALDVLAGAFLVFVAAACCIAMLREERA